MYRGLSSGRNAGRTAASASSVNKPVAERIERNSLLRAEQIARAAQLEIAHRNPETGAEFARFLANRKS